MSNSECLQDTEEAAIQETRQMEQTSEQADDAEDTEEAVEPENKVDESDEDIPGDFFDDFLKEDFMAGLDIVDDDEWDEKIKIEQEIVESSKKRVNSSSNTLSKETTENSKKRKKQKLQSGDTNEKKERRCRQKKKRKEEKNDDDKHKPTSNDDKHKPTSNDDKHKRSSDKQIDADEFDIRRDPEKTKRDIARDKVRCEKDKEMKIISEKLNLVETGLVPPGMEMEIDIEEVKRQKEKLEVKSPRDLREHLRDLKEKNRSPGGHRIRTPPRKRSLSRRSPNAKKVSPIRRRSRSPRREPLTLIRSALSPLRRSPRRSPLRRSSPRRSSPRPRSSERIYSRRKSRSHSPYYRNRRILYRHRERSTSRESDREKWLKRRNRSRSPRRKREEKKSFLQEIAEKLNEIRQPIPPLQPVQQMQQMQPMLQPMPPTLHYIQPQPLPVPPPAPVPPPESVPLFPVPRQQQQYDPYDQNFFIGPTITTLPNNFPSQNQPSPIPVGPQIPLNPVSVRTGDKTPARIPARPPNRTPTHNPIMPNILANISTPSTMNAPPSASLEVANKNQLKRKLESQEDIEKLFQDKQITLSEFLAITAKPEVFSSSPKNLQEKIKVITRCHDAIKFLSYCEKKFSGRLIVHKTDKYKLLTEKNTSPLLVAPPVKFTFTNPIVAAEEHKNSFTKFIDNLLQSLGLLKDTVVNIDDEEMPGSAADIENQVKFSPPPPPLITPITNPIPQEPNKVMYNTKPTKPLQLCKTVQTDVLKCQTCEARKKILNRSTGVQSESVTISFSVSTQVTEEDFQHKIPKTQSLAALTPAQLLAKSRESLNAATRASHQHSRDRIDVNSFDILSSGLNRSNYFRPLEGYGLSRPNLSPYPNSPLMYDALNVQMMGGGVREREPEFPRPLDPRYSYNNYY